ncbi:MAG: hypothetical protein A2010_02690 [Nitrospirae bacterium GWD2_57_9]|nr:MAG: hypothetical protein A2010_02690 [Nitrospirae bacterium GWD2_57_9]
MCTYLSSDPIITTDDTYLGRRYVFNLAANTDNTATHSVAIPSGLAAGTYYIGSIADCDNTVLETEKGNNSGAGNQILVTNP